MNLLSFIAFRPLTSFGGIKYFLPAVPMIYNANDFMFNAPLYITIPIILLAVGGIVCIIFLLDRLKEPSYVDYKL